LIRRTITKKTCMFQSIDIYNCLSRNTQMASSSDCYTSSCSWESSNYYWDLFNYQAVLFIKLFPWCEDCAHIIHSARSDIHTRNQLVAHDTLPGCYYWLQGHEALGKCTRYKDHIHVVLSQLTTAYIRSTSFILRGKSHI
jgi:hypothetical protein